MDQKRWRTITDLHRAIIKKVFVEIVERRKTPYFILHLSSCKIDRKNKYLRRLSLFFSSFPVSFLFNHYCVWLFTANTTDFPSNSFPTVSMPTLTSSQSDEEITRYMASIYKKCQFYFSWPSSEFLLFL